MIFKFLLMLGLIPLIGSFLARKFFSDRVLKSEEGGTKVTYSGKEMVERILKLGKATDVEIQVKKRPFLPLGPEYLVISPQQAESKEVRDVAGVALIAGMVFMARQQDRVVAWRTWAVKFGYAMPGFTIITMIFAMVVGRVPPSMAVAIMSAGLGLSTLLLWSTLAIEKASAKVICDYLDESALVPRISEAELMEKFVKAHSWKRIVPGAVAFL